MTYKEATLRLCDAFLDMPSGCDGCPLASDDYDEDGNMICALNKVDDAECEAKMDEKVAERMRGKYLDPYSGFEFDTDYIPREAARCLMYHKQHSLSEYDLNNIQAADVVPVVHGRWVKEPTDNFGCGDADYHCLICRRRPVEDVQTPYCPYCGAKMDEVNE